MAKKMCTAEALCFLLMVSAGLSAVHGSFGTDGPLRQSANSSAGSGLIRNLGPNASADFPRTQSGVSSSGGDSFLVLLGSAGTSSSSPVSGALSVSGNLGGSTSQESNLEFVKSVSGANLGVSSGSLDVSLRPSLIAESADRQVQRIVNIPGSFGSGVGPATVLESSLTEDFLQEPVTITQETTVDVFKTISNIIYNSVPITLTEFVKTTEVAPTLQVISTPVDDRVFVATAPVAFTQTVTVTNTNTGYLYATEVSTDVYTVTHKAYNIRQRLITSTLQQTQVFRPTIVRTRINTEYDTQTVEQTVFNTIVIQPRFTLPLAPITQAFSERPFSNQQQFAGQGQQLSGQGQQLSGQGQQLSGQGQQLSGQGQQLSGQGQQLSGQGQQLSGQGQQLSGQGQQLSGQGQQLSGQGQQLSGQGQQLSGQGQQLSGQGQQLSGQGQQLSGQGQQLSGQGQQLSGQGQQLSGQGQQLSGQGQQLSGQGQQLSGQGQQLSGQGQQLSGQGQQLSGQGQQLSGQGQQLSGQGQQLSGQGQQLSGQGQQLSSVRNPQGSQQTSSQGFGADQPDQRSQQLLNLQLPVQGDGDQRNHRSYAL